ncbi:hypothetical protein CKA32_000305 [Geitlerinema sp. FC II]|nr:hypothetical protein CKA32_000305 [Geitlerinema sp. FC II]
MTDFTWGKRSQNRSLLSQIHIKKCSIARLLFKRCKFFS